MTRGDLDALRAQIARVQAGSRAPGAARREPSRTPEGRSTEEHMSRPGEGAGSTDDEAAPGSSDAARDPHSLARAIVLRQLENSPKTRRQLEVKLTERGCDPAVAAEVLDRLTQVGLVDDVAYAEMFVRAKQVTRGLSRQALTHELRRKGVADEVAAEVIGGVDSASDAERARDLVRARLPRLLGLQRDVQIRRLSGLLARKGYPSGLVMRVVLEEVDALPEHRRD